MNMQSLTFLVVEDHEMQRKMVVKMLKGMKAKHVYSAADGCCALELMQSLTAPLDIIVSDLDMPAMDGMEFIRHIGTGQYATSLIIASALERGLLSSVESMAAAYGINFLGTIEKPVTPRKLEELIRLHKPQVNGDHIRAAAASYTVEEIMQGLADDQFEPFFQPKVDIATGAVVGAEALARWRHPQQGIIGPYAFVGPLEDGGRIDSLMRCMLTKGAAFCRELHASGEDSSIAVNVSVKSLCDVGVADQITEIVQRQRVHPRDIVLEITESAAMTDVAKVLENLARLRMKGFQLAIDDYGTGYSSLEQLSRIPFTELKIDQSFVTHAGVRESSKVILASSLEMARRLRIHTVAEGVETTANWELLVEFGCEVAQGYYISCPLSGEAYVEWLQTWGQMHGRAAPRRARHKAMGPVV